MVTESSAGMVEKNWDKTIWGKTDREKDKQYYLPAVVSSHHVTFVRTMIGLSDLIDLWVIKIRKPIILLFLIWKIFTFYICSKSMKLI